MALLRGDLNRADIKYEIVKKVGVVAKSASGELAAVL